MARRGRPPKPTALKILAGNPGKRPLNPNEPKPAPGAPPCPAWLHKYAKAEWRRVVKVLLPLGLVTQADLAGLASYCTAYAELRLASETLEREGRTVKAGELTRPHPAAAQQKSALAALRGWSQLFGLDPSSRSRLSVEGSTPAVDPFDEFLAKRGHGG